MITISKVEYPQDKNGNTYKRVFIGNQSANVFPKDPLFQLCTPGAQIDAALVSDGVSRFGKPFYKLQRTDTGVTVSYQQEPTQYDVYREKKEDGIQLAQMRKDDSIKQSSTFRDATLLLTAQMAQSKETWDEERIKTQWRNWRSWLLEHWESHEGDGIPF